MLTSLFVFFVCVAAGYIGSETAGGRAAGICFGIVLPLLLLVSAGAWVLYKLSNNIAPAVYELESKCPSAAAVATTKSSNNGSIHGSDAGSHSSSAPGSPVASSIDGEAHSVDDSAHQSSPRGSDTGSHQAGGRTPGSVGSFSAESNASKDLLVVEDSFEALRGEHSSSSIEAVEHLPAISEEVCQLPCLSVLVCVAQPLIPLYFL